MWLIDRFREQSPTGYLWLAADIQPDDVIDFPGHFHAHQRTQYPLYRHLRIITHETTDVLLL
jgi:hypothetical protein